MVDFVTETGRYQGPDRRKGQRRKNRDRRDEIRFEPDKDDRRSGKDRRSTDHWGQPRR
jgi:hypothetical protein